MYDLHSNIDTEIGLAVQTIATDTTTAGAIIDTQGFEGLEFIAFTGAYTDGDYTLLVETGEDPALADAVDITNVDPQKVIGDADTTPISNANQTRRIGVVEHDRYVRLSIVSANTTTGATVGAIAVPCFPKHAPVADL